MSSTSQSYRVIQSIRAVRLTQETGKKGTIVLIPPESVIFVRGPGLSHGLMKVEWDGELYSVASEDLQHRTAQLQASNPFTACAC